MPKQRKDYRLPPRPTPIFTAVRPEDLVVRFPTPAGTPSRSLDFSAFAHRPRLAAELAFALRHHLADKTDGTRQVFRYNLASWFEFLDEHDPAGEAVRSALDIDAELLRAYIAWLDRKPLALGTRYCAWSTLKQALAWLRRHRLDLVQPELELPANVFPGRYRKARPRAALAGAELDAVLAACRSDIEASWADFETGRALLAAADRAAIASVEELSELDLKDFGVLLALLAERYNGVVPSCFRDAPNDEMPRSVRLAVRRHGGVMRISRFLHATADILMPYMIAIAAQSFANPAGLRGMLRDCMSEHVVFEGRWLVTWHKGRAGRPQRRTFLRDRGLSVPNLIDRVRALTAPLVPHAPAAERDKLFLCSAATGRRRVGLIDESHLAKLVRDFAARHDLRGLDGAPLALTLASLRATGLALAHEALGHDVTKTQALANHASPDTTTRYVHQPAVRAAQAAGLARLQGRFVEAVRDGGRAVEAGDAAGADAAPQIDARNATASGFICSDPLSGIALGQRKGRLCTAWLGCFTCPNAVIPLEADTLARLLLMRDALARAHGRMALDRWRLLYAPKLEILERDVLPRFPAAVHAEANELMGRLTPPPPIE